MARYIDLEEFERRIKAYINADPMDSISESALIGWCKDECIRQAYAMPRADVVPKSEVEMLQGALKAEERHNKLTMEMAKKALANAKAEVAREIFEEIEKEIDRGISVISKILNTKGGRANGKTVLISKYDVFIEAKKHIAELKKKYTEENKDET